jgi:putative transcriptional regulator
MATDDFLTGEELGRKLLESVRQMNAGQWKTVYSPVATACAASLRRGADFAAGGRETPGSVAGIGGVGAAGA